MQIIDGKKSWLTDEEGNKIPVSGEGAVTPILKVSAKGYWMVSYDRGVSFKEILDENGKPVKAVGENGKDGTEGEDGEDGTDGTSAASFFKDVKVDEENSELVLTLKDGTVLRVSINKDSEDDSIATVTIKGTVDFEDLEGLMVQSFVDESILSQKDFSLNVISNDLPQLVYVTDKEDNIIMMARGYFQEQSAEINAQSTALALISMMSAFVCYNKEEFDKITDFIIKSTNFETVVNATEKITKNKKDLFCEDNAELLSVLNTYAENLSDTPQLKSTEIAGINKGPLDVRTTNNEVIMRNTGLNPPLEVQVYYGGKSILTESGLIASGDSYRGLDFITGLCDLFSGNSYTINHHYGKSTEFLLTEPGEYYFVCDKLGEKALDSFQMLVIADFLSMLGLEKDLHGNFGYSMDLISIILELQSGTISIEDAGCKLLEAMSKKLIALGAELSGYQNGFIAKTGKFLQGKVVRYYSLVHGLINQNIRLIQFKLLQSPIEFNLCYYKDEFNIIDYITCCTNTQLKIIAGNNQSGIPTQSLKLPLTVAVETKSDDGNDFYNDMQRIKFEVVSGGGYLENRIVEVNQISLMANDNWVLGRFGEQKVRVVAIDLISGVELSEPVYFTASLTQNVITDKAEVSGTDVTLYATLQGYDTNAITYGICYSTENEPTSSNGTIVSSSNIQDYNYSVQLSSLVENQIYYWRAYMRKDMEYIYGEVKSFTTNSSILDEERDILVAFYNVTGGDNWTNNENWCSEKPLGEWYGITLDEENKVYAIDLNDNNIIGSVDLSGLEHLRDLRLNGSNAVNITSNKITSINLSGCVDLEYLYLNENKELRQLTLGNGTNKLIRLELSGNSIDDCSFLSDLHSLEELYINNNLIKQLDVSSLTSLRQLQCENNELSELDISNLSNLESLFCTNNKLTGIDVSFLKKLTVLSCGSNQISNMKLCNSLEHLYCGDNKLTGLLDLSQLDKLKRLYCYYNQLTSIDARNSNELSAINELALFTTSYAHDPYSEKMTIFKRFIYQLILLIFFMESMGVELLYFDLGERMTEKNTLVLITLEDINILIIYLKNRVGIRITKQIETSLPATKIQGLGCLIC